MHRLLPDQPCFHRRAVHSVSQCASLSQKEVPRSSAMVSRRACAALALLLLAVTGAHAADKLKITILASGGFCSRFAARPPRPSFLDRWQAVPVTCNTLRLPICHQRS